MKTNKSFSGLLALMFLLSIFTSPVTAEQNVKVILNGTELAFDVPPQLINDRTMVPMRKIFGALGATIEWDEEYQLASAKKDAKSILLFIGSTNMYINDKTYDLDVAPIIVAGRTLVPVRAVSEGLDADVRWDGDSQTVIITTKAEANVITALPTPKPTNEDESTTTPKPKPTPTNIKAEYYEINSGIPDYTSITGKKLLSEYEPNNLSSLYQYCYEYEEADLINYTNYLQNNGFIEKHRETVYYSEIPITSYYSKGADGFIIRVSGANIYICVFKEGTAENVISSKSDAVYKENDNVPNFGSLMDIEPIRFDAGFTASGNEIAMYLYPYETRGLFPAQYEKKLQEYGWERAGGITDGPLTKVTFMRNKELMGVIADAYLNMVTVSFSIVD